jgi:hypothetical protein
VIRGFLRTLLQLPIRFRRWIWLIYVLSWTTALLVPNPAHAGDNENLRLWLFLFAKAVHVSAYAMLAILTGWLRPTGLLRWLLLGFLILHAAGTEYLQYVMDVGRTGCWSDVWLNLMSIGIGIGVSWKWWTADTSAKPRSQ